MKPPSCLFRSSFFSSSFPSTQPTIPVLSEASDRDMNVIFPLVFLTAVLNSYKTLKTPQLLPDGSLSLGYLFESLERASLLPTKNSCQFNPSPISIPAFLPLLLHAYRDFMKSTPVPALIHKNLMK